MVNVVKVKLEDMAAPLTDILVNQKNYSKTWSPFSIAMDLANIFVSIGKETVASTLIHADTLIYNILKLSYDCKSDQTTSMNKFN